MFVLAYALSSGRHNLLQYRRSFSLVRSLLVPEDSPATPARVGMHGRALSSLAASNCFVDSRMGVKP